MPADRFIHPRLGHSAKVNLLTDLEFRVWIQYILSADDFGVMRRSAVTIQADSDHLSNRPKKVVERCLDALIQHGLLRAFSHQGRSYVYQPDWQDFQRIGYPRGTDHPTPPADALERCSSKTIKLFERHPLNLQQQPRKDLPKVSEIVPESFPPSRAREMANGLRLTALDQEIGDRGAKLLELYPEWYAKHRNGARVLIKPALDFQRACDLCRTWPDDRLEKMAVILLTTDDGWVSRTDRGFGVFVSRASWCDDRLKQWELENGVAV